MLQCDYVLHLCYQAHFLQVNCTSIHTLEMVSFMLWLCVLECNISFMCQHWLQVSFIWISVLWNVTNASIEVQHYFKLDWFILCTKSCHVVETYTKKCSTKTSCFAFLSLFLIIVFKSYLQSSWNLVKLQTCILKLCYHLHCFAHTVKDALVLIDDFNPGLT